MKWILKLLPNKLKVWLYKCLYEDIAEKGEYEDTELAHVNPYEVKILKRLVYIDANKNGKGQYIHYDLDTEMLYYFAAQR